MIDTKALRSRVLDLAIQGKLTEQLESDGTAEELWQQIQAEKQRLIKEGKLKKEKPLPEISEEEIPFEIPGNWKWVRLSEICQQITDGTHRTPSYQSEGIPFLSVKNISSGFIDYSDIKYISASEHSELIKRCKPEKNDILICRIGTLGKAIVIESEKEFSIFVSLGLIKTGSELLSQYIVRSINSGYGVQWIKAHKAGNSMHADKINLTDLCLMTIPLPPLAEQKRIVARVEEIFRLLDIIDAAQEQYAADAESLKAKLITLGIQGRLTEQLANDGTAEELYQQIQAEKQRLIKEGKIKREKPLPEISEDEIPFEIPENWKWVRLGNIVTVLGGKRIPAGRSLTTDDTGHKYIRVSDMKNLSVDTSNLLYVPEDIYPSISRYIINKEDVYITVAGTIGRVGTIPDEIDGANLTENADRLVFSDLDKYWLVYCLYSNAVQKQIEFLTTQVAQPKLAIKRIQEFCIPLPPLAEQKRIVETLERVLG